MVSISPHRTHVSLRKRWVGVRPAGIGFLCICVSTDINRLHTNQNGISKTFQIVSHVSICLICRRLQQKQHSQPFFPLPLSMWIKFNSGPRQAHATICLLVCPSQISCYHMLLPENNSWLELCLCKFRSKDIEKQFDMSACCILRSGHSAFFHRSPAPCSELRVAVPVHQKCKVSCRISWWDQHGSTIGKEKVWYRNDVLDFFQRRECERHGQ